jgi:hypothetical protein
MHHNYHRPENMLDRLYVGLHVWYDKEEWSFATGIE